MEYTFRVRATDKNGHEAYEGVAGAGGGYRVARVLDFSGMPPDSGKNHLLARALEAESREIPQQCKTESFFFRASSLA